MMASPPDLTQAAFLTSLVTQFPALASDIFDEGYQGVIHLQVSCLACYANACFATARLDELARVIRFCETTVERVLTVAPKTRFTCPVWSTWIWRARLKTPARPGNFCHLISDKFGKPYEHSLPGLRQYRLSKRN